ncbi:MAG: hypothetical protein Q7T74_00095 [Candidatus Saccharibacteria bacterium]|nr:hypothetical protein [Candidatus Saccharibacteria bacterium]
MKKQLIMITSLILALAFNANAQITTTVSPTGASTNSIVANSARILSITVTASATNTATVRFVDSGTTNLTYTIGSYTNTITYATNIVSSFVTFTGVTNNTTNAGVYTVVNTVAASTNSYPTITTIAAGANATVTWTPAPGQIVIRGVTSTNDLPADITIRYVNSL